MTQPVEHVAGITRHTRRGDIQNGFAYSVDYVLVNPEINAPCPLLFSRNHFNLNSVHDADHGGPISAGRGTKWVRDVLRDHGLADDDLKILLLTQPRFLNYVFNPVSFWLIHQSNDLIAVIAEVSTPFNERHSYLCHQPNFEPITKHSKISKPKLLHVSPFQQVAGAYDFTFDINAKKINIRILYRHDDEGVIATLTGPRHPLTNSVLIKACLRRPLGSLRTSILIYWQALRLKIKGAIYRTPPTPPNSEVS